MAIDWEKDTSGLSVADIQRRQPYKLEPHHFTSKRRLAWPVCKGCGILLLKNEFTAWAAKMGCNAHDRPEFTARAKNAKARR